MNRNKTTIKVVSVDVPHITEHFHQVPYLDTDPDICYEKYKDMVIDPFVEKRMEQTIQVSTEGFDRSTMLDMMFEQMGRRAGQKMFLNYIYGVDLSQGDDFTAICRDHVRKTWEIIISPLWSETLYRVRPIDIQKGGWKCQRRTRLGSTLARGAETQKSIQ